MGGQAAGGPMGWAAGRGAVLLPGLHGRLFGADADLARRRAARPDLAQGQARRGRSEGPLMDMQYEPFTTPTSRSTSPPSTMVATLAVLPQSWPPHVAHRSLKLVAILFAVLPAF